MGELLMAKSPIKKIKYLESKKLSLEVELMELVVKTKEVPTRNTKYHYYLKRQISKVKKSIAECNKNILQLKEVC
jgi:hypothetical protein